jgi:hypothetical protein
VVSAVRPHAREQFGHRSQHEIGGDRRFDEIAGSTPTVFLVGPCVSVTQRVDAPRESNQCDGELVLNAAVEAHPRDSGCCSGPPGDPGCGSSGGDYEVLGFGVNGLQ